MSAANENCDYKEALKLQEAGSHTQAEAKYREAMGALPNDVTVVFRLACLLTGELGRHEEAETYFRKAITCDPDHLNSHFCLADLLACHLNRCEEAEGYYREALRINPRNLNTHFNLGALLTAELGRHMEAEGHYRAALCIDPEDADSHFNLAELLKDYLNRPAEAEQHYMRALEIDPDDKQVHCNLGKLLTEQMNKHEEAEQAFSKALEIDPDYLDAHVNLGLVLTEMLEKHTEAERHFRAALDLNPSCLDTLFNLADLLTEHGSNYSEAEELYRKAISLCPDDFDSRLSFGQLLTTHLGKHEEAEEQLRAAMALDPTEERVRKALSDVLIAHLGKAEEAEALLNDQQQEPAMAAILEKDTLIAQLKAELVASKEESQVAKTRKSELAAQLKETNKELGVMQREVYEIKEKNSKLESAAENKSSIRERQLQVHVKELMAELTESQKHQLTLETAKEKMQLELERSKFAVLNASLANKSEKSESTEAATSAQVDALEQKSAELETKLSEISQELQQSKSEVLQHKSEVKEMANLCEEKEAAIKALEDQAASTEGTALEAKLAEDLELAKANEADAKRGAEEARGRISELSAEMEMQNELMDELVQASANSSQVTAELGQLKEHCAILQAEANRANEVTDRISECSESGNHNSSAGSPSGSMIPKPKGGSPKPPQPQGRAAGGRRRADSKHGGPPAVSTRRRADSSAQSSVPSFMRATGNARARDPPKELRSGKSQSRPRSPPTQLQQPARNRSTSTTPVNGKSPKPAGGLSQIENLQQELVDCQNELKQLRETGGGTGVPAAAVAGASAVAGAGAGVDLSAVMPGLRDVRQQANDIKSEMQQLRASGLAEMKQLSSSVMQALSSSISLGTSAAGEAVQEAAELKVLYRKECKRRKTLYNQLQEIRGNLRVFCRMRPLKESELEEMGGVEAVDMDSELGMVRVHQPDEKGVGKRTFDFDQVYGSDTSQEALFADVDPLITSILDGYNVCIFAYGQTGSGKTHTMVGPNGDPGVSTRAVSALFREVQDRHQEQSVFTMGMFEVYNDELIDLLDSDRSKKLQITQNKEQGIVVQNLNEVQVSQAKEVQDAIEMGMANRSTGKTNMNAHSSRSHLVLKLSVRSENTTTGVITNGKLSMVDLAGSERIAKSGAEGERLKEAQAINKSLSALGDVVRSLVQSGGAGHIPYRNSKLTHVLADSIGGDSKTLMFCNISPLGSSTQETLCSLNFAAQAKDVVRNMSDAKSPAQKVLSPLSAKDSPRSGGARRSSSKPGTPISRSKPTTPVR